MERLARGPGPRARGARCHHRRGPGGPAALRTRRRTRARPARSAGGTVACGAGGAGRALRSGRGPDGLTGVAAPVRPGQRLVNGGSAARSTSVSGQRRRRNTATVRAQDVRWGRHPNRSATSAAASVVATRCTRPCSPGARTSSFGRLTSRRAAKTKPAPATRRPNSRSSRIAGTDVANSAR